MFFISVENIENEKYIDKEIKNLNNIIFVRCFIIINIKMNYLIN